MHEIRGIKICTLLIISSCLIFLTAASDLEEWIKNLPNQNYKVVVSAHDESLSWLDPIPIGKVIIYNKGGPISDSKHTVQKLPNIGRESHTYLNYIIENYHNLPDIIFFTQGHVGDHQNPERVIRSCLDIRTHSRNYGDGYLCTALPNCKYPNWDHFNITRYTKGNMIDFFREFVDDSIREHQVITIYWGAIFSIRKEYIRSRPLEYYKKLISQTQLDILEPESGHFFERSWFYIFNLHRFNIFDNSYDIVIVGGGLSGAVLAERYANLRNKNVLIVESKDHIGGNAYDYVDQNTNLRINKYGPHIFHTNDVEVWNYIHKFSKWVAWKHRESGKIGETIFPFPINIESIDILLKKDIRTPQEMRKYLDQITIHNNDPKNSWEACLNKLGTEICTKVYRNYIHKKWNLNPEDLVKEEFEKFPISLEDLTQSFYTDQFQGLPEEGYTKFFEKMLSSHKITILYSTNYFQIKTILRSNIETYYSGSLDSYFSNLKLPKLQYRTLNFQTEVFQKKDYQQSHAVIEHFSSDESFSKTIEYKHFLYQNSNHTIIIKTFYSRGDEEMFLIPERGNIDTFNRYKELTLKEKGVRFIGSLSKLDRLEMDQAIRLILDQFKQLFKQVSIYLYYIKIERQRVKKSDTL